MQKYYPDWHISIIAAVQDFYAFVEACKGNLIFPKTIVYWIIFNIWCPYDKNAIFLLRSKPETDEKSIISIYFIWVSLIKYTFQEECFYGFFYCSADRR